jgi:hypothetical protein
LARTPRRLDPVRSARELVLELMSRPARLFWEALDRVDYAVTLARCWVVDLIYGPEPPTLADKQREADYEQRKVLSRASGQPGGNVLFPAPAVVDFKTPRRESLRLGQDGGRPAQDAAGGLRIRSFFVPRAARWQRDHAIEQRAPSLEEPKVC